MHLRFALLPSQLLTVLRHLLCWDYLSWWWMWQNCLGFGVFLAACLSVSRWVPYLRVGGSFLLLSACKPPTQQNLLWVSQSPGHLLATVFDIVKSQRFALAYSIWCYFAPLCIHLLLGPWAGPKSVAILGLKCHQCVPQNFLSTHLLFNYILFLRVALSYLSFTTMFRVQRRSYAK